MTIDVLCDSCKHDEGSEPCMACVKSNGMMTKWTPKIETLDAKADMVNKPNHYQLFGDKDCFDVMVEMFGKEAVQTYCVLNAFTYLFRHARKNGTEDVLKAEYNLAKFKELEEIKNG